MENSSRFVIMAGGLLLGVFLLTSFIYVFRAGARASRAIDEEKATQQAILENSKFEFYNRGNKNIEYEDSDEQNTISDMISLINLVYSNNKDGYNTNRINLEIILPGNGKLTIPEDVGSLERNQVYYNGSIISVYDLLRDIKYTGNIDLLTESKLIDGNDKTTTKYKYIFPVTQFEYNDDGRVKKMKFESKIVKNY